ncbi:MAG TPA: FAD-dependent oxidoreductase [Anaerolineae bacterium]|nr:FAD-dependent oxidoreductase [Anaerolineae bacterium]
MKRTADVVVIGGGIQGLSCAYHLAAKGIKHVSLVELDLLGSGSSGRSAAMLMLSMSRPETIAMSFVAWKEYMAFPELLGEGTHFKPIGYMTVATRAAEPALCEEIAIQQANNVPIEVLDPEDVKEIAPAVNIEDIVLGAICRTDGVIDPHAVMQAYARGAKQLGAEINERVQATGIVLENWHVTGVETTAGTISTPIVVNATGARAREVGSWVGLDLPIKNYKRHIFITDEFKAIPQTTPFVMDLEVEWYFRKEGDNVLMGMGREESTSFEPQFEPEFQEKVIERAAVRAPILLNAKILRGWAGLRALTPDDLPILGYAPGVEGFVNCCGWGGHGVMHAPTGGILTAEVIADGKATTMDITPYRYERFL